jgi:hypothetical protein
VRQEGPAGRSDKNGPVKVIAAAFDRDGRSVQSEQQTVGVTWRRDGSTTSSYEVVSRLALKPGRYEVRVALDGGPNQRASVYTYVDVPDFVKQPLSLSGLVFAVSPAAPSAPADAFANLLPVVPTAQRAFARTDRASAFLQVYQDGAHVGQPVSVTARVADRSDRIVLDQVMTVPPERFTGGHAADYRLELPVERLEPGEYLLTIQASQGQSTAGRSVRFTVR